MREQQFIEQNKEKWREFETLVHNKEYDPERLGELFVQITDDLSYARTFYPNRSVRVYLNHLAQQIFHKLYKSRKKKKNALVDLLINQIPSSVFHARRELLLSLTIFILSVGAGVLSGHKNPQFARTILSDHYVEMTEKNIEKNDPMAVYKDDNQFFVFGYIALRNLRIDFYTFVSGLFFGIWTIIMLISNGVMVGAFQYFFAERGLFSESFLTIWMHGTLEMSAAVIAGGAGLILGRGIVFPGTYSRLQSLIIAARHGLKILMIAVIMTTIAAVIESFLTRYTEIPNAIRLCFIALSFLFVAAYFIVLPWMKNNKGNIVSQAGAGLLPDLNQEVDLLEIKGIGRLFSEGFIVYRGFLKRYLPIAFLTAAAYTIFNILTSYKVIKQNFVMDVNAEWPFTPIAWTFANLDALFSSDAFTMVHLADFLLLVVCLISVFVLSKSYFIKNQLNTSVIGSDKQSIVKPVTLAVFAAVVLMLMFNINGWLSAFIIVALPFMFVVLGGVILDNSKLDKAISAFGAKGLGVYGLYLSYAMIGVILFTLLTYPVFQTVFMFSDMLFGLESIDTNKLFITFYVFFTSLALLLILPAIIVGLMLSYFNGREITTATGLQQRLETLISHKHSEIHTIR